MTGEAYAALLDALHAHGCRVYVRGDRARATCPAHQPDPGRDRSKSLSVRRQCDRVLVNCFGGCTSDVVLAALRMPRAALFDAPPPPGYRPPPPPVLNDWDRAMLDQSERFGLGWHGPGDYPPVEHLLHRIEQQHQLEAGTPPDHPRRPSPPPDLEWLGSLPDGFWEDYAAWVVDLAGGNQ